MLTATPPSRRRKRKTPARRKKPGSRRARKAPSRPGGRRWIRWIGYPLAGFLGLTVLLVLLYRVADPPSTPLMWIRWAQNGYPPDQTLWLRPWIPLDRISPRLVRAVLTAEDQKFFLHHGFDWPAVRKAIRINRQGKRRVGASTLTMQTARNVFLWQDRTWLRKGLEAYFTVLIEWFWSKERILEVYLNIVEWGDGLYGCEAASRAYFNHSAGTLSYLEAARLAALLPNPRVWSRSEYHLRLRQRQHHILTRMLGFTPPRRRSP